MLGQNPMQRMQEMALPLRVISLQIYPTLPGKRYVIYKVSYTNVVSIN
jgi:hypothetical protein